jgi:hypothetical protein
MTKILSPDEVHQWTHIGCDPLAESHEALRSALSEERARADAAEQALREETAKLKAALLERESALSAIGANAHEWDFGFQWAEDLVEACKRVRKESDWRLEESIRLRAERDEAMAKLANVERELGVEKSWRNDLKYAQAQSMMLNAVERLKERDGRKEAEAKLSASEASAAAMREALSSIEGTVALRPEVRAFAALMENELRENDHKGGWKSDPAHHLLARVCEEVAEVVDSLVVENNAHPCFASALRHLHMAATSIRAFGPFLSLSAGSTTASETADVANMIMMVADVCGVLDPVWTAFQNAPPREHPMTEEQLRERERGLAEVMKQRSARRSDVEAFMGSTGDVVMLASAEHDRDRRK